MLAIVTGGGWPPLVAYAFDELDTEMLQILATRFMHQLCFTCVRVLCGNMSALNRFLAAHGCDIVARLFGLGCLRVTFMGLAVRVSARGFFLFMSVFLAYFSG